MVEVDGIYPKQFHGIEESWNPVTRPFFSVVIPTYNRAKFLRDSVESVLSQTFEDLEVIVVDDGSTDYTSKVLDTYDDLRIRTFRLNLNGGKCKARNLGIERSSGEWICFLDSDDVYFPNHLKVLSGIIQQGIDAYATTMIWGDNAIAAAGPNEQCLDLTNFIKSNPISINQICYRRSLNLRFPADRIDFSEDLYFMRVLSLNTLILKVDVPTVRAREHAGRGINNVDWVEYTKDNIKAASLFVSQFPSQYDREILAHTYLLAANDILSNKASKSVAKSYLRKSLEFNKSALSPLLLRAAYKLMFF